MREALKKYAKRLKRDCDLVHIRRVMWIDVEARIRKIFNEVKASPDADEFGGIIIHRGLHPDAEKLYVTERLNQLQITCMPRFLGVSSVKAFEEDREIDGVMKKVGIIRRIVHDEGNSAMWFSQSPTGGITVFMSPYKSDLVSMNEKEIIIGMFKDPSRLTERKIRILFARYFKYLTVTSALHNQSLVDYAWRLWLMYLDVRSRKVWKTIVAINVLVIFLGAMFTVIGYFLKP